MHIFDRLYEFFNRPSRKQLEAEIKDLRIQAIKYQYECMRLDSKLRHKELYDIVPYKCKKIIGPEDLYNSDSESIIELCKVQMACDFADKFIQDNVIEFDIKNDILYGGLTIQAYMQIAEPREKHLS